MISQRLAFHDAAVRRSGLPQQVTGNATGRNTFISTKRTNCIKYEECSLLGSDAVWLLQEPMLRTNVSPPSLG
jgi:hypothetical protein